MSTTSLYSSGSARDLEGFKVKFAQRCHSPAAAPKFDHLNASRVVLAPDDIGESSIILGERGRKRFPPQHCIPSEHKAGKRHITPPKANNEVSRGKRYIPLKQRDDSEEAFSSKKQLLAASTKRSESSNLPSVNWKTKSMVKLEDGTPAGNKESEIYNLETNMNQKQRVSEDGRRNLIPSASAGDKAFKLAEYEPGFYEKGGLIPGSTNTLKQSAKPTLKKTLETSDGGKKLEATYGAMKKKLEFEYDQAQVHSLTVAGSKQGRYVPSWEERTGCFLVAPEDEAF